VQGAGPPLAATVRGALHHHTEDAAALPAVGDFVALRVEGDAAVVEAVLPRRSAFIRHAAGSVAAAAQVVAANVDVAFLVCGLGGDFNPRRIERYLAALHASGAAPVVVLNKLDLHPAAQAAVASLTVSAPVLLCSALNGVGVDALRAHLGPGRTGALVGSSGVGKSTLINALLGETRQTTQSVRADDDRGRHTTTHRELLRLPDDGGLLIDTPGMRELGLWTADTDTSFGDIAALAEQCRFRDCQHGHEPGCAVRAAIEAGALDEGRLAHRAKLAREAAYAARQQDERLARAESQRWKQITRNHRAKTRHRDRNW